MEVGRIIKSATMGMPSLVTGGVPGFRAGEERLAFHRPELSASQELSIYSDAFFAGGMIPFKYSADGDDVSPPLRFSGILEGAQSLVLMVEDPDAPTPEPFVHWLLYNMPADLDQLPEDVRHEELAPQARGAMQGKNSNLKIGWTGMAPPKGDTPHHYHFQLFALDCRLPLQAGEGRSALVAAMGGHVIAKGDFVGLYQRS